GRYTLPGSPTVSRRQDHEAPIDRIAERDATLGVPERHRVEKYLRVRVRELQIPVRAAVDGLVNPRRGSGADAQRIGNLVAHRVATREVGVWGPSPRAPPPVVAAVGGTENSAGR